MAMEDLLRRIAPAGAPLPDEDHLDFSFCSDWQGPALPLPHPPHRAKKFDASTVGSILSLSRRTRKGNASVAASGPAGDGSTRFDSPSRIKNDGVVSESWSGRCSLWNNGSISGSSVDYRNTNDAEDFCDTDSSDLFSLKSLSVGDVDFPFESSSIESVIDSRSCKASIDCRNAGHDNSCNEYHHQQNHHHHLGGGGRGESVLHANFDTNRDRPVKLKPLKVVKFKVEEEPGREVNEQARVPCSPPVMRGGGGGGKEKREACVVSNDRGGDYSGWMLKGMGWMQEGRNCVSCMGFPTGKTNYAAGLRKILWGMCSPLKMTKIKEIDRGSSDNGLRPDQILVNGKELTQAELTQLLGCSMAPKNLKPGRYWYDKDTGLWGKEGLKPDRFIMPKLNVGGKLQADASNGNTNVFMNGREITKFERRHLKLAKVHCPPATHLLVYDDGSYEEEGQNNRKGNIWGKSQLASRKTVCPSKQPSSRVFGTGKVHKLLLPGLGGSGSSTIFNKQVAWGQRDL
ncbi:hypothetical protein Dimus_026937 [Dionaea muscipula]